MQTCKNVLKSSKERISPAYVMYEIYERFSVLHQRPPLNPSSPNLKTSASVPLQSGFSSHVTSQKRVSHTSITLPARRWSKVTLWEQVRPQHSALSGREEMNEESKRRRDETCSARLQEDTGHARRFILSRMWSRYEGNTASNSRWRRRWGPQLPDCYKRLDLDVGFKHTVESNHSLLMFCSFLMFCFNLFELTQHGG